MGKHRKWLCKNASALYLPWLSIAEGGDLSSGFMPGFTSQMILETYLAADFPLESGKPFRSLMAQLGWPYIRCHSRLCEWEGFEAHFRILVSSEESSRGHLYCQERGKHLGQDFAVSPHKFTEAIKSLTALFSLPLPSVHRVFPLWSFHSFCTPQMKYKHPEGNVQVPARAVPFSGADSRGHWALLCCSWKIKLCLGAHESL